MGKRLRILAFSDLHCDAAAAREIVRKSSDCDWVIGAGDFANVRRGIDKTIDVLRAITRPTFVVPGNGESFEELREACRDWPAARVLHGTAAEQDGVPVFGIGGAIPVTPFGDWSYDFSEDEAARLLATCPARCVMISHSPPHGLCDRSSTGRHLGSTAVLAAIDRAQPRLVLCGHIHDSWGQRQEFGSTLVLNAGPQAHLVELSID
jgi:Icc-related predicted phosphoesterase